MTLKIFTLCAFAFTIQVISGQSYYRPPSSTPSASSSSSSSNSSCGSSSSSTGSSSSISVSVPDNGGSLTVTSVGPIRPLGITVTTDLGLAGNLDISGSVPYLSAVAFEGQFETNGTAPVSYGCGECVAITQEVGNPSGQNAAVSSGLSAGSINTCGCVRRS